jgi:hypothetical protein
MRVFATGICLAALLAAAASSAQAQQQVVSSTQRSAEASSPDFTAVYCSGFVTNQAVPSDVRLISGEESNANLVFASGDVVFINRGAAQGVKIGDRYQLVRVENKDPYEVPWFKWQNKLMKAMGIRYRDTGQVEIINVQPNVSTGKLRFACDYVQRGDIALPFTPRPSPPYKPAEKFDTFAPVSGKSVGMVVAGVDFAQSYGKNSTVYVNLGNNQGVKVGDYIRVFRYEGSNAETVVNLKDYQYTIYGFGGTPVKYKWNDLPREIIGEGVVINVSGNSSSVFLTYSKIEMYAGDYAEIE